MNASTLDDVLAELREGLPVGLLLAVLIVATCFFCRCQRQVRKENKRKWLYRPTARAMAKGIGCVSHEVHYVRKWTMHYAMVSIISMGFTMVMGTTIGMGSSMGVESTMGKETTMGRGSNLLHGCIVKVASWSHGSIGK